MIDFTRKTFGFTRKTLDFTRKTFDFTRKTVIMTPMAYHTRQARFTVPPSSKTAIARSNCRIGGITDSS